MNLCLAVLLFAGAVLAGYQPSDAVVQLTDDTFDDEVMSSDEIWLVEFYAPWCGHCKNLEPDWKKAAKALKGIVNIAAVDADQYRSLGGKYGVQGFPTIKVFGANKKAPKDYDGERSAEKIVSFAMETASSMAFERLGVKKDTKSGGSHGSHGQDAGKPKNDDVIELTESNFDAEVLQSKDIVLVEFFAPWCGHCKNLAPEWAKAATQLKGKVKVGAVDATVHAGLGSRYEIKGYPTIKVFINGEASEYNGGRTAKDIVEFASQFTAKAPEVKQLTAQSVWDDECKNKQLCFVAFLPHILDSSANERESMIDVLEGLSEAYKRQQFAWFWAEAGSQLAFEEGVGVGGYGYPALVSINTRKSLYASQRGAFTVGAGKTFIDTLLRGKEQTRAFKAATIVDAPAWDGKDGEQPAEVEGTEEENVRSEL